MIEVMLVRALKSIGHGKSISRVPPHDYAINTSCKSSCSKTLENQNLGNTIFHAQSRGRKSYIAAKMLNSQQSDAWIKSVGAIEISFLGFQKYEDQYELYQS